MRRARLQRRLLRGAALIAALLAIGCQSLIDSDLPEESKREPGLACKDGVQCESGFCVDSFCCSSACDGKCDACSANRNVDHVNGECSPVVDWYDPDDGC